MKVKFLSVAEVEFEETVVYYNQESEGLGFEFAAEVRRALERIVQFSDLGCLCLLRNDHKN